jgi:hypothetical protein
LSVVAIDLSTVAVLLIVLWLDGWRRVEPGDVLVKRVGLGAWDVHTPTARIGTFALAAWWPPVVLPVIISAASPVAREGAALHRWTADHALSVARARRRLRRASADIAALRVFGTLQLVWIAFVIPLMTAHSGGIGLLLGIAVAFAFAAGIALVCFLALWMSGARAGTALGKSFALLSPFSAARAPEIVIAQALDGVPSAAQLAALLCADRFAAWVRPWAYDETNGRRTLDAAETRIRGLVSSIPAGLLSGAVALVPDGGDEGPASYCPRCGHWYHERVTECSECTDVPLHSVRFTERSFGGGESPEKGRSRQRR